MDLARNQPNKVQHCMLNLETLCLEALLPKGGGGTSWQERIAKVIIIYREYRRDITRQLKSGLC